MVLPDPWPTDITGCKSTFSTLCMSLSFFWEWEKDLTLSVFIHFTTIILLMLLDLFQPLLHCCARKPYMNKWSEQGLCSQGWCRAALPTLPSKDIPGQNPWDIQLRDSLWAGPIRSVQHSLCSRALSLGKSCKGKGQALHDFKWTAALRGKSPQCQISSPWYIFDSALVRLYWVCTGHRNYLEYPRKPVNKLVLRFWLLLWQSKARRQTAKRS